MFRGVEAIGQIGADFRLQAVEVSLIKFRRRNLTLGLARLGAQFVNRGAELVDFGVRELDRVNHGSFFHFLGARLDHHNSVSRADDHDVKQALAHFAISRIDDELAIDQSDAHCADGAEEWNVRNSERRGSAVNAGYVRVVFGVGGKYQRNHLGLALEAVFKKRAHWTINLAAGESFALAHAAFALDEAAGDASASVGVFAIV